MEIFGWLLYCVLTKLFVKIHLKTSCSTARTKTWLEKGYYWNRKVHFILVPEKLVFFFIFNSNHFFKLFGDDSWWWKYLDSFYILLKADFLLKYTWKPVPILLVPKAELKKTLIEIEKYTSFSYQKSWFFFHLQFQSLL